MGREVRKVPADWQHPKDARGRYVPLLGHTYAEELRRHAARDPAKYSADEYFGLIGLPSDYMPEFENATHLMIYETCTEGTPITPAFATPEELARWAADNGASAYGSETASYEAWLAMIREGSVVGAVIVNGTIVSGVQFEVRS